jgi:hypothetical protein
VVTELGTAWIITKTPAFHYVAVNGNVKTPFLTQQGQFLLIWLPDCFPHKDAIG